MDRRPRRLLSLAAWALGLLFTGLNAWYLVAFLRGGWTHNDWYFYFVGSLAGQSRGWDHLYDFELQRRLYQALLPGQPFNALYLYVSPPPLAFLVTPLTWLGPLGGYAAWLAVNALAFAAAAACVLRRNTRPGPWAALIATGFLPVAVALQKGQPVLLVAAGTLACWALLEREREVWAGAVVVLLVLKPQLGFLLPLALLASGRSRAFAAAAVAAVAVLVASAAPVGLPGLSSWVHQLGVAGQAAGNQRYTLTALLGPAATGVRLLVGLAAMIAAWRHRKAGPSAVIAIGLIGSLLASPYLHLEDLAMLVPAAWASLRAWPDPWRVAAPALGLTAVEAGLVLPNWVGSLALLLWLAVLLVAKPGMAMPAAAEPKSAGGAPAAATPEAAPGSRPGARP